MNVSPRYRMPTQWLLVALAFAVAHLLYEHFNGGVQSHHLLNRADLPAISNWVGLLILPVYGWLFGLRLKQSDPRKNTAIVLAGVFMLVYGAALARAFEFDQTYVSATLFIGLFVLALALPLYRVEFMFGFVLGMTMTFGSILPALIISIIGIVSLAVRSAGMAVFRLVKRPS